MAQQFRTTPTVKYDRLPGDPRAQLGELYNTGMQISVAENNKREGDRMFQMAETQAINESNQRISTMQRQQAILADTSNVRELDARVRLLKARGQLFSQAAQVQELERAQTAREADYALAEPFADLGAYAGNQNWGSFYLQRKSLVANPLYKNSREIRSRMEAIDQMLPQWGQATTSSGDTRSFLDVSRDAESPDWATKKEALRILAAKSENPQGFLTSFPGVSPVQRMEVLSFMQANPLVEDPTKLQALAQFKQNVQSQAMEASKGNPKEFLKIMSSPETNVQMQEASRAILYGQTSEDMSDISARDKTLSAMGMDQLEFYINDKIDNSAGWLSVSRGVSELTDIFRNPQIKNMSMETLLKVIPPEYLDTFDLSTGEVKRTLENAGLYGTIAYGGHKLRKFSQIAKPKRAGVLKALFKVFSKKAAEAEVQVGATKSFLAKGAAKVGSKTVGMLAGLGLDAAFFWNDAGHDMSNVREAMGQVKQIQSALRAMAVQGSPAANIQDYLTGLQRSIDELNIISERHGVNVRLDMNNVFSNQMLRKLRSKLSVGHSVASIYNLQPMIQSQQPQQPQQQVKPVSYDQIGSAQ